VFLKISPQNPDKRRINKVVECLKEGGIIIYPTDTVYGLGCDIFNTKAMERIYQIKQAKPGKDHFSFVCYDLSHLSDFTLPISNITYKLMRKFFPGAFTFILKANNKVPKLSKSKKRTVGIRVPDNEIARTIVKELGHPILSTSLHHDDQIIDYMTDPKLIYEKYAKMVDIVIDAGAGNNEPSTVIDCTGDKPVVIREGKGKL